ncbi:MAG: YfhO family protein [Myxococcales bacterium]
MTIAQHLPLLQGLRFWEKMTAWPGLLVAVAAAIGIEQTLREGLSRRTSLSIAGGGLALVAAGLLLAGSGGTSDPTRMLLGNLSDGALHAGAFIGVLGLALLRARPGQTSRRLGVLLASIVVADLAVAGLGAWGVVSSDVVAPPSAMGEYLAARSKASGLQRVLSLEVDAGSRWPDLTPGEAEHRLGALTLQVSWNALYRVGSYEPYAGPQPKRVVVFSAKGGADHRNLGFWSFGHVAAPDGARDVPPGDLELRDDVAAASLLRIPARPRAYVASLVGKADRNGALGFAVSEPPTSSRTVIEAELPADYRPVQGTATIERDEPERVDVRATAQSGPALVVLNDLFAPGWTVTVDGQEAPIVQANFLARGVWIPAGEHLLSFQYRTPGLATGLALLLVAAAALVVWALLLRRQAKATSA